MNHAQAIQRILEIGVLPVANIKKPEWAQPLAKAMCDGGIPAIEVLARSQGAFEAMRCMKASQPDMLVGAGTILTCAQAAEAIDAGADFIVSPGFDPELVELCLKRDVAVIPGCTSASEIQQAYNAGLRLLKFFPAQAAGGLAAMKDFAGPFQGLQFLPTGGITLDTLGELLASSVIGACGGSFVAPAELLAREDFQSITERCRQARKIALGFTLAHVGINHASRAESEQTAKCFASLFCMPTIEHSACVFAGSAMECNDFMGPGERGHIGVRTTSMLRACAWLRGNHVELREDYRKYNAAGKLTCVYLKQEIGGFAIHVVQ